MRSQGTIERYDQVIQDQIKTGIVERVGGPATGQHEFYIPHEAVVRDTAETTKLRVVYDASAQAHSGAPSLNECLNPGPPLQNKLWSVLVRSPFHPVAVTGDIKQAFLQVRIKEQDRDALRFYWLKDPSSQTVETLRFTRALFGLTSSPFPLELSCDTSVQTPPKTLNADAPVYRPRRDAAAAARFRIQDMNENEQ